VSRPVLRTQRIELRPLTLDHLPHLIELDADPQVLRYILGRARTETEACDFWGPICGDAYADHLALGWWAGFATAACAAMVPGVAEGDFLGWWDLSPARTDVAQWGDQAGAGSQAGDAATVAGPDQPRRAEAGWRVRRALWRQGLATEGARALVAHGFDAAGLDVIWAETMAVNAGSRGVMRALGMRHVSTDVRSWSDPLPGAEHGDVVYEIDRVAWARRTVAWARRTGRIGP
jgi:RimJ/RimL family protein N-acetyltransferase